MKLVSNIKEVITLDEEPVVGCLVKSVIDENATGMIVEFLSKDEIMVLWNTPPRSPLKNREIW